MPDFTTEKSGGPRREGERMECDVDVQIATAGRDDLVLRRWFAPNVERSWGIGVDRHALFSRWWKHRES